jgi:hypothetical protein
MKYLFLSIFIILTKSVYQGNTELILTGQLLSQDTNEPIPFATIIDITNSQYATTTKEDGFYRLKVGAESRLDKIHFSSLGFKDTTLIVSDLLKPNFILYLKPKSYTLPDFEVISGKSISGQLGNQEGDFFSKNDGVSLPAPGFAFAAFLNPPNKKQMILDSVQIYLSEKNFSSAFTLRALSLQKNKKPKESKLYPIAEFDDLLSERLNYEPNKAGWFTINLSNKDVSLPKEGMFLVFNQLYTSDKYYWKGSSMASYIGSKNQNKEQRYGHLIGIQKRQSAKILDAMYTGDQLGIVEKDNFHGAIVVYYSYRK